jgi:sugar-specific transcriptional regulator TrmB
MDLLAGLTAIGFTEYEAKVYVALLRAHPASGYQVSKDAGIPRSMVYEALGRLHARGAVLRTGKERTTLYRPVPPEALLDRYAEEQHHLLKDLRQGMRALYTAQAEAGFWSIAGGPAVLSYAVQMIERAQVELFLVVADMDLEALRPSLVLAGTRGVAVNALLTGHGELGSAHAVRHPAEESELQELQNCLIVVADAHEVLIATTALEVTATITTNPHLVFVTRQFVWQELSVQGVSTDVR